MFFRLKDSKKEIIWELVEKPSLRGHNWYHGCRIDGTRIRGLENFAWRSEQMEAIGPDKEPEDWL